MILSVDGREVPTSDRLAEMIASHAPGSRVALGLMRGGRFVALGALVDALPDKEQGGRHPVAGGEDHVACPAAHPLGITVRTPTPVEAASLGRPALIVDEVEAIGPAAGHLEPGDAILEIDRAPVHSVDDFRPSLRD